MKHPFILALLMTTLLCGCQQVDSPPSPTVDPPAISQPTESVKNTTPEPPSVPAFSPEPIPEPEIEAEIVEYTEVPIFMYHEVSIGDNAFYLDPKVFEDHLQYLQDHNFHTITVSQLLDHWVSGAELPENPVCLTFDDGYRSMYTNVLPLMEEYHSVGTFFIVTNRMDETHCIPEMLREMDGAGMEIGSHTCNHVDLSKSTPDEVTEELTQSKAVLEEVLGHPIRSIAYPYGGHSDEIVTATEQAGYEIAVTTVEGVSNESQGLFNLKRISVYDDCDVTVFAEKLN